MRNAECNRCGFPVAKTTGLHSKHTNQWYCPDMDDCSRRATNDLTLDEINVMASRAEKNA